MKHTSCCAPADSQLCASADALSASLCAPQPGDEELKYDVDYAQGLVRDRSLCWFCCHAVLS